MNYIFITTNDFVTFVWSVHETSETNYYKETEMSDGSWANTYFDAYATREQAIHSIQHTTRLWNEMDDSYELVDLNNFGR